jgi:hypothetical protein
MSKQAGYWLGGGTCVLLPYLLGYPTRAMVAGFVASFLLIAWRTHVD